MVYFLISVLNNTCPDSNFKIDEDTVIEVKRSEKQMSKDIKYHWLKVRLLIKVSSV